MLPNSAISRHIPNTVPLLPGEYRRAVSCGVQEMQAEHAIEPPQNAKVATGKTTLSGIVQMLQGLGGLKQARDKPVYPLSSIASTVFR